MQELSMNTKQEYQEIRPFTQFYQIPKEVMTATQLSMGARLLYGIYLSLSYQGKNVTNRELSNELGIQVRQVQNYTKELEENGFISVRIENRNKRWIRPLITNEICVSSSAHSTTKARKDALNRIYAQF